MGAEQGIRHRQQPQLGLDGENPVVGNFPTAWASDAELTAFQQKLSAAR